MPTALRFGGSNEYATLASAIASIVNGYIEIDFTISSLDSDSFVRLISDTISGTSTDRIIIESNGDRVIVNSGGGTAATWSSVFGAALYVGQNIKLRLETTGTANKRLYINSVDLGTAATSWTSIGRWIYIAVNFGQYGGFDLNYIDITDYDNASNSVYLDPDASSHGTGTPVLLDTANSNDATGVNMATDGSVWINTGSGTTEFNVSTLSVQPTLAEPVIDQTITLSPSDTEVAIQIGQASIETELSVQDLSVAVSLDSVSIAQTITFDVSDLSIPIEIDDATIEQVITVNASSIAVPITLGQADIDQDISFSVSGIAVSVGIASASFEYEFTASGIEVATEIESPSITQEITFSPDNIEVGVSISQPTIVDDSGLTASNLSVSTGIGQASIAEQVITFSVDSLAVPVSVSQPATTLELSAVSLSVQPTMAQPSVIEQLITFSPDPIVVPIQVQQPTIDTATIFDPNDLSIGVNIEPASIADQIIEFNVSNIEVQPYLNPAFLGDFDEFTPLSLSIQPQIQATGIQTEFSPENLLVRLFTEQTTIENPVFTFSASDITVQPQIANASFGTTFVFTPKRLRVVPRIQVPTSQFVFTYSPKSASIAVKTKAPVMGTLTVFQPETLAVQPTLEPVYMVPSTNLEFVQCGLLPHIPPVYSSTNLEFSPCPNVLEFQGANISASVETETVSFTYNLTPAQMQVACNIEQPAIEVTPVFSPMGLAVNISKTPIIILGPTQVSPKQVPFCISYTSKVRRNLAAFKAGTGHCFTFNVKRKNPTFKPKHK